MQVNDLHGRFCTSLLKFFDNVAKRLFLRMICQRLCILCSVA